MISKVHASVLIDGRRRREGTRKTLAGPMGIAVSDEGMVFVADTNKSRVQVFHSDGRFARSWGEFGESNGQFIDPQGICIDSERTLVIIYMRTVPELCALPPGLLPICAEYIGTEYVHVSDTNNDRIQTLCFNGEFVRKYGSRGNGPSEFDCPIVIRADGRGNVCVADSLNHRVQLFRTDGTFLDMLTTSGCPSDIAMSPDNRVYIIDLDGLSCWLPQTKQGAENKEQKVVATEPPKRSHRVIQAAGIQCLCAALNNGIYAITEFDRCSILRLTPSKEPSIGVIHTPPTPLREPTHVRAEHTLLPSVRMAPCTYEVWAVKLNLVKHVNHGLSMISCGHKIYILDGECKCVFVVSLDQSIDWQEMEMVK